MKKSVISSLLAITLSVGPAGIAAAADVSDAWLTTKTKIALMTADGVSAMGLNVDTVKGMVTLHGKVTTEAEKAKAEEVAKGIEGVAGVKNLLQVVPPSQEKSVEATDDALTSSLERAWKNDKRLSDGGVSVASVNKGVVLLSGNAKTIDDHLYAVESARSIKGVKRVSTEVTVSQK